MFNPHHTAISVRNVDESVRFYELFGFQEKLRWVADDGSLTIVHLALDGYFLEIFAYAKNAVFPALDGSVGNELEELGVKHMGVVVRDLETVKSALENRGGLTITESREGRTGIDYFFVRDPDGLWLEVVQDDRNLL